MMGKTKELPEKLRGNYFITPKGLWVQKRFPEDLTLHEKPVGA